MKKCAVIIASVCITGCITTEEIIDELDTTTEIQVSELENQEVSEETTEDTHNTNPEDRQGETPTSNPLQPRFIPVGQFTLVEGHISWSHEDVACASTNGPIQTFGDRNGCPAWIMGQPESVIFINKATLETIGRLDP